MSGPRAVRADAARAGSLRAERTEAVGETEQAHAAVVLPPGHPAWPQDLLALTRRARAALAALPRVFVQVLGAWDHPRREALVAGCTVVIDGAGTYRVAG